MIRSEPQLMEQMDYNLITTLCSDDLQGLGSAPLAWVPTVFTKSRDRLLATGMPLKHRMRIEEAFGWADTAGGMV